MIQPALLRSEIPLSDNAKKTIATGRAAVADILSGKSDKIVVIVGPCSIHNVQEAREYCKLLKKESENLENLVIIARTYFEKVRRFT